MPPDPYPNPTKQQDRPHSGFTSLLRSPWHGGPTEPGVQKACHTYSVQKVLGTSFTPCKKGNSAGQGYVSNRHIHRKSIAKMFKSIANPPSTPQISTAIETPDRAIRGMRTGPGCSSHKASVRQRAVGGAHYNRHNLQQRPVLGARCNLGSPNCPSPSASPWVWRLTNIPNF